MAIKLFNRNQIREWDKATISSGISSIDLMERAALVMANRISELLNPDVKILIVAGCGNNGGDALAIARILSDWEFNVIDTFIVAPPGKVLSPDTMANASRISHKVLSSLKDLTYIEESLSQADVVIEGLFGTGFKGELNGIYKSIIELFNSTSCPVISIDIPSGMTADGLEEVSLAVMADVVLSLHIPKRAFLLPASQSWMNGFELLDIGLDEDYHDKADCSFFYLEQSDIQLPIKNKFDHKGKFGPALIIAGSNAMTGAAVLACEAALRSGVGVLHLSIPAEAVQLIQTRVPEVIVEAREEAQVATIIRNLAQFKAVACGPGIGMNTGAHNLVLFLLNNCKVPLVLDADALNIIAQEHWHERIPKRSILTPHHKEFTRLFGEVESDWERILKQQEKSKDFGLIIVLKGAHSSISLPDGRVFFNSTGNPLMATPGSGDVLCGLITALLAQGFDPIDAAITGVYVHGQAGDRAAQGKWAMCSSDIVNELGKY